jgi:hypothetical protein
VIRREHLQAIAAPIAKQEEMARQGIPIKALAGERGQAINRPAEVRGARRQV